ncbi:MAG: hypothetical protein K0S47_158 [Herbinix sp.]|jgi:hypothetical protein|nr:hypothetical protein [Herbinix sp.]
MKYEDDHFLVYYDDHDKDDITQFVIVLKKAMSSIMSFFRLSSFQEKKIIRIWGDLTEYVEHIKQYTEYQEWIIADTFDKNINILSYELYLASETHKWSNRTEYQKVIVHEFVHSCQQEVYDNAMEVAWFWEALATNLSEQKYKLLHIPYTANELSNHYNQLAYGYNASYTIGQYLLQHVSQDEILHYVKNPQSLLDVAQNILDLTNQWVESL